jgi:predicted nucleic acid-binding protein
MKYIDWNPCIDIESPVYIDANIFVGAIIRGHNLYHPCVKLIGNLLTNQSHILVSLISAEESLWALTRQSYIDLNNQAPNASFTRNAYKKWCAKIFATYGSTRIGVVSSMLRDWSNAGLQVEVIPKTETLWKQVLDLAPLYMEKCELFPADAFHLALAETHAKTFITADSDFASVPNKLSAIDLVILHVVKESLSTKSS